MDLLEMGSSRAVCWDRLFPGTPDQTRVARSWVQRFVPDGVDSDEVAVAVSEVFTNALLHSASGLLGGTVLVSVVEHPEAGEFMIVVTDEGTGKLPGPAPGLPDREGGRGMGMVTFFASSVKISGGLAGARRSVRVVFSCARVPASQTQALERATV